MFYTNGRVNQVGGKILWFQNNINRGRSEREIFILEPKVNSMLESKIPYSDSILRFAVQHYKEVKGWDRPSEP